MTREVMWGAAAAAGALAVVGIGTALVLTTGGRGQDASQVEVVNATDAPITPPTNPVAVTIVTTVPSATTSTAAATTTIATTTSTVAPTTTVATTPAPPPGRLEAAATDLDLGIDRSEGAIAIGNSGGQPIDWATSSDNALVDATRGGALAPGAQTDVTIAVSRSGLIEGEYLAVVSVLGGGRGIPITVRWRVERAPVVRVNVTPAGLADAATCPADAPDLAGQVTAAVIDESGLASVLMGWSGPGAGGSVAMVEAEPGTWSGALGPLSGAGSWTVLVTATDARGNVGTGATTLLVTSCPA